MMISPLRHCVCTAAALLAGFVGCSTSDVDGASASHPNGIAAEANARFAASEAAAAIASGPLLVIGGDETNPEAQFDVVGSAAFVGQRHIAVANGGSAEIFLFDYDGRRVATLGGLGGGPGEFAPWTPIAIPAEGDTIPVAGFDLRALKIAYFAQTGELLEEHIASPEARPRGAFSSPAVDPSGLMFFINFPVDPRQLVDERGQPVGGVFRLDVRTGFVQQFTEVPPPPTVSVDLGPMRTFGGPPIEGLAEVHPIFAARSEIAGGGEPFLVAIGTQSDSTISIFDADGVLQRRIFLPGRPRTPTREQVELAREEFFASTEGRVAAFRFIRGADGIRDLMPIAERTPVFRAIEVSITGDFWVERYPLPTDPAVLWWVFSPDGQLRGESWVPHGVRMMSIGTRNYLGLTKDEMEIERVEMWPVVVR